MPPEGETLDAILGGALRLYQPRKGNRITGDPLFLAGFLAECRATRRRPLSRICDLGAGTGALGLALALRVPGTSVTLVELQPRLAALATRNAELNGMEGRVEIVCGDLRSLAGLPEGSFDLVAANPPYGLSGAGPAPAAGGDASARHELTVTLGDVVRASRSLARPRGGRVGFVVPAGRAAELLAMMVQAGARPRRARFVHPYAGSQALLALVLGERSYGGPLSVEPPLVVHEPGGAFTREAHELLTAGRTTPYSET